MEYSFFAKLAAEFLGTAILVLLGNGSVANVELKGTKGNGSDWLVIAVGYGCGVMVPALMFGTISGAQINPAFTIGLAVSGMFSWSQVLPFIIAQMLGAIFGQLVVYFAYKPHYDLTTNTESILGTFSTIDASHSSWNGFANEFIGSFVLFFGATAFTHAPYFEANKGSVFIALGFLVGTLVASLGGATGPALNPARDLGPRLVHAMLPIKHKGSSQWGYASVPVVAPILAGICAVALYKGLFL
ncbi:MIP/aquaporin family protein [Pediococcus pentosaceus]|jgi:glycerol uptake facilitator protein|uniref:Aquaporin family protein n=4 Tax=Lactobacillaceae TaxID=33958 RepID=A0A0R2H7S8_PEDPE|nr:MULTISPECIES: MIP/aquaporin family protein [Pediococcus]ABJ68290.1 Glycerol uptake facilitator related permease [Pediococcus pentosaceus ATCC 25745]AHA05329.1 glycerol uptake permease [Pediococcus pentosaceus SL4]ANI97689.1 aquaporin [Pediococcus pentosaceus]ARW19433.1 Glycerol facilitator-aquaporin gla [Pediococcus pentosaceus]ASC08199.1 Glycerol facilitator-aquaporin gla [Pediococcus pentosaceus]